MRFVTGTYRAIGLIAVSLLAACGTTPSPRSAAADFELRPIAPGAYWHPGKIATISLDNRGDIANLGLIVGQRCAAVIDTGSTRERGLIFREAIRSITDRPVCYVINTHAHPDHSFGNAAFAADHPQFVGHPKLAAALRSRARNYLAAAQRDLGALADQTEAVMPTQTVNGEQELDLGGRVLRLKAWPTAHTDHDLSVLDVQSNTLWAGDLVFNGHLPVIDGNLKGWMAALQAIAASSPTQIVAGHGALVAAPARVIEQQLGYLSGLRETVRAALKKRLTLAQTVENTAIKSDIPWALVDFYHRRNVTAAYAELEWDD